MKVFLMVGESWKTSATVLIIESKVQDLHRASSGKLEKKGIALT